MAQIGTVAGGAPPARRDLVTSPLIGKALAGFFVLLILATFAQFVRMEITGEYDVIDFDAFHLAGRMIWDGRYAEAYDAPVFMEELRARFPDAPTFFWMYPPHYGFLSAVLALMPRPLAYLVFTLGSFAAFAFVLHRLGGRGAIFAALAFAPAFYVNLLIGQNGFLTGAIIGLFLLMARANHTAMGAPLAFMSLKPQLALAPSVIFLFLLTPRRFAVCLATGLSLAVLTTLVFGIDIWRALLETGQQSKVFAEAEGYRLEKFISYFGVFASAGVPPPISITLHGVLSVISLGLLALYRWRGAPLNRVFAIALIGLAPVSPYAYEYDLPAAALGLALLAPDILARTGAWMRLAIVALGWGASANVLFMPGRIAGGGWSDFTLAGVCLGALALLLAGLLTRAPRETPRTG